MKTLLTTLLILVSTNTWANCRGCCSGHGGVTCTNGATQCSDGSSLSNKCLAKLCNQCGDDVARMTVQKNKKYSRKEFRHWTDEDGDCQNTRAEVLIKHNKGELKFKTSRQCVVVSGLWVDPYSGKTFTKASDLDADHIIPLKYAYLNGAARWSKKKKRNFANDPENILPVWKKLNRQKGAKGPLKWMPPFKSYQCDYLKRWKSVQRKYKLSQKGRGIASVEKRLCD